MQLLSYSFSQGTQRPKRLPTTSEASTATSRKLVDLVTANVCSPQQHAKVSLCHRTVPENCRLTSGKQEEPEQLSVFMQMQHYISLPKEIQKHHYEPE
ncbi:hypothetical protein STEG23_025322 [Scotinomys teguina]